jgi:hypothetical protein
MLPGPAREGLWQKSARADQLGQITRTLARTGGSDLRTPTLESFQFVLM